MLVCLRFHHERLMGVKKSCREKMDSCHSPAKRFLV